MPFPQKTERTTNPATGQSYPLGMWIGGWASSFINSEVARIILQEKIGFNVRDMGIGYATVDGFYALTGCANPETIGDRGCDGVSVTYTHVNVEAWTGGYQPEWDALQIAYPDMAPINLGNMGYNGKTSFFFPSKVRDEAWETEGLNLDFFRGYNISWHDAAKYFDSPKAFDGATLRPCNETRLMITSAMKFYAELTGDWDGVEIVGEEVYGKCFDDHFWYPPACRSNASACFVWLTAGNGWDMEGTMQKTTSYHIPMAAATAKNWTLFTQLPKIKTSWFYWWVPDPTFLTLSPMEQAWDIGDKRTQATTTSVDIAVSRDLHILAPNVQNFLENWEIPMAEVNKMMMDQINTGEDAYQVACRWLQDNKSQEIWTEWLPDTSKCFPQFGLWNTNTQEFVADRQDKSFLECRACESGRFSEKFKDNDGDTYICTLCPPGTSQPSGAALQCEPCLFGEFQDKSGQTSCKRCIIGEYQDQKGQARCIPCVAGTTTLGDGRPSVEDCGCIAGSIDIGEGGNKSICNACPEGMTCPFSSSEHNLLNGTAKNGPDFVPAIVEGYYSTKDKALQVFKCRNRIQCPGGRPNTCGGGLQVVPCAECPAGQTWSGSSCDQCTAWSLIFWVISTCALFGFLTLAYYLLTSQVTAKASVMATTGMSFGMTVNLLQSVGIVGMMTVEWPEHLQGFLAAFKVLLLDIDNYSFSCFAGADSSLRYSVSVSFFLGQAWLVLNYFGSKLLPARYRWGGSKAFSTMGQFWQVGFSTMSTVSLAPLTSYTHPNGLQSLLKYPNIICGGDNGHTAMMAAGLSLLVVGVFGFLSLCIYAAYMMPKWSAGDNRQLVQSFRFLVFRFRLDSWWYGVPLLVRGPLLSLPIVLATDYPPVQTIMINVILSIFLIVETLSWPWKVPLLNLMDMWMTLCLMLLVTGSALYVSVSDSGAMQNFASAFTTGVMGCIGAAMLVMFIVAVSALVHRAAMGGATEYAVFNLGKVSDARLVRERLQKISAELLRLDESWMNMKIGSMSAFDIRLITSCITLLAIDLVPHKANELKFNFARVSAQSFAVRGKTQKNIYREDLQLSMEEKDRKARLSAASLAAELAEEGSMEEPQVTAEEPAEIPEPESAQLVEIEINMTNAPNFKSGWV